MHMQSDGDSSETWAMHLYNVPPSQTKWLISTLVIICFVVSPLKEAESESILVGHDETAVGSNVLPFLGVDVLVYLS